ncbi:MAG TPA: dinitrogenase iron-molybdenum cofactor biosynthesis protein [Chloroflexi bacterium]|nr:dinitrogenase iron-molybdenum cofactor biosynthesis protein [Chloroflexota bacterium]
MRLAISADDSNGLDSVVSPHFGRCPYYVLVDLDDREVSAVDVVENPFYSHHQPGQVPGFIDQQGVDVMLAGGMGRRAIAIFQQYDIEAVTGAAGSVRHALEQYLGGALEGAAPCRESVEHEHEHEHEHQEDESAEYEEDAVGRLREEAQMLQQQLNQVMKRLDRAR